jgi:hypothetical protein
MEKKETNLVTNIGMTVSIRDATKSDLTIIGHAKCQTLQQTWRIEDEGSHLTFDLTLDHYTLSQIEKIRKSGDLNLNLEIRLQAFVVGKDRLLLVGIKNFLPPPSPCLVVLAHAFLSQLC